jgi:uncharacterized peroxidase-related enzyme
MSSDYRMTLPPQTIEHAEPKARAVLERAKAQVGFVPNMFGGMANSPGLLATYLDGYQRFREDSGLTPVEQEVVFLTISRGNGCEYCVAAHSVLADTMSKVPAAVTDAIRGGHPIPDAQLAALSTFTEVLRSTRGLPSAAEVRTFLAAGFEEKHVLEIILALAVKTLSNYANHLFHPQVDAMFAGRAWQQPR